jgi:Fe-S-cluster containining protein
LVGDPSKEEIARINRKLRPFYAGYNRIPYEDEGRRNEYLSKTKCPFLGSDNSCEIYAHRPIGCQAFPKTDGSMDTEEGYCESIDRFRSQLEALLKGLRKYVGDDYFPEDGVKPVKMTKKRYELCVARLLGAGMTCEELACFRYLNRQ